MVAKSCEHDMCLIAVLMIPLVMHLIYLYFTTFQELSSSLENVLPKISPDRMAEKSRKSH